MRMLVRHHIPDLMVVDAGRFVVPAAAERAKYLRRKLFEEVGEFVEFGSEPDELADINECCVALAEQEYGLSPAQFTGLCEEKIRRRGHLRAPGVMWVVGEL